MKAVRHFIAALTPRMKSAPVVGMMMLGCVALTGEQALGQCNVNIPGVPDFDQKREETTDVPGLPNDGKMYCAPTSATDWFAYIANHGLPEVLDGPRDWQSQDNYNFVTNRIADVGELMGTDGEDGTNGLGQYLGTVSHLQATAPGAFTVSQNTVIAGWSPTPEMLYDTLDNGGFVSMTLGKYKPNTFGNWERTGGHIVALHRVQNGCSESPTLWWRNPSTKNSESKTQQATFSSQDSEMEAVTGSWATFVPGISVQRTMWRFLRYEDDEQQKFLDSFMTITPLVALTTDDQWETIEVDTPSIMDAGEEGQDVEESSPNGGAFDWFEFHPLLTNVFYATTEDDDDGAVLYKYDPKLEHLREIMRLRRRTPIVFGRHGELYLVNDGVLTQLDTKQNSDRPTILRQFDLKGAMPNAMVYNDAADEVTLLFAGTRRLLTLSRDLSSVRDRALPSQIKFVGEALMANNSLEKSVWLASTKSQSFYKLGQISGKDGQWQTEQTITLPGVDNPTSLQVSESGNLVVVEDGIVHEFAYDARSRRWTETPKSYVAGMRAGRRLVLARSRTNFDAKWMTGPGWTNYEPETIDETGETPDCPADLTGSTDPRNPMWGMPNGVVDGDDYTYFLMQHERGNLLVTDLTGSKDPRDLLLYGAPDGRLTADDVLYYHERYAGSLGRCPEEIQ
jgi:hypothetical protein